MTVNEMIDNAWLSCQIGSKVMNVFANDGMLLVTADINPMDATTLQCRIDRYTFVYSGMTYVGHGHYLLAVVYRKHWND